MRGFGLEFFCFVRFSSCPCLFGGRTWEHRRNGNIVTVLGSCEEHWTCSLGVLIIWVKFLELDLEFGGFFIIFIGSLAIQAAEGGFLHPFMVLV